ncbi:response regulator transcription factor [Alcanivorax sp. JB21]|uniref:response regulator n=1 Tax=Alcanivorax limicola TaxID=2874102 RepID=UPI001CBFF2EF|nr:response regulator transcription factor [Alcanivorax limicola]MBZ2188721.1 response regulator transcription factor [Alcanivorax limicola]
MQNVLIVEDHEETRQWLAGIVKDAFASPGIHEAGTLEQARALLQHNPVALALVDLSLPDGSGMQLLQHLQECSPETYLVVTTIFDDDRHLFDALQAGANGYLLKDQPRQVMIDSLAGIATGKPPLSPAISRRILRHFQQAPTRTVENPLSEREVEVLMLLAKGMGRSDIAELLNVSVNTAASHIKSIYRKLNVSGRAEATLEAVNMGIVPQSQPRR